jgi:D-alanine-D-alanine ligase
MASVLVIAGSNSPEREVSLRSGASIVAALREAGHKTDICDPAKQQISSDLAKEYDVAFPIVHGLGGEDGSLQEQLEAIGLPYVGSDVTACRLTFDKSEYKRTLAAANLPLAKGALVQSWNIPDHPLFKAPFVLKPYDGGSSVDTFIIRDVATAPWKAMQQAMDNRYGEMLLEELIEGVEITVGVLENQALPVIEIVPPADGEFDYENKYNGATQELCPPIHVDEDTQKRAQELALEIHKLCGCRDLSRTDMIVTPDNRLIVLETNTLPGMTDQSLFPKAAQTAGLTMSLLCDQLVQLALHR